MTASSASLTALACLPAGPSPIGYRAAAYLDLGKMILATSSAWALGTPTWCSGLIPSRALAYRLITQIPYPLVGAGTQCSSSLMEYLVLMLADTNRRGLVEVAKGALATAIRPAVYAEALDPIKGHRRAGHDAVAVSVSASEMVAPIVRLVGADRAVATRMEVGEDGLFIRRASRSMLHSEKMVALHGDAAVHGIDPARCWAYSDSISDEPMLSAVGHPIVINPDRDSRCLTQERDWPMCDFARPVRPWSRWELSNLSTRVLAIVHVISVLAVGGIAAWLMA